MMKKQQSFAIFCLVMSSLVFVASCGGRTVKNTPLPSPISFTPLESSQYLKEEAVPTEHGYTKSFYVTGGGKENLIGRWEQVHNSTYFFDKNQTVFFEVDLPNEYDSGWLWKIDGKAGHAEVIGNLHQDDIAFTPDGKFLIYADSNTFSEKTTKIILFNTDAQAIEKNFTLDWGTKISDGVEPYYDSDHNGFILEASIERESPAEAFLDLTNFELKVTRTTPQKARWYIEQQKFEAEHPKPKEETTK